MTTKLALQSPLAEYSELINIPRKIRANLAVVFSNTFFVRFTDLETKCVCY